MKLIEVVFVPFLTWLLNTSAQVSVLIILVVVIQWGFRQRLPARWHYNLWLLVVIRMFMPFTPESGLSIFNLNPLHSKHRLRHEASIAVEQSSTTPFLKGVHATPSPQSAARFSTETIGFTKARVFFLEHGWKYFLILWVAGALLLFGYVILETRRFSSRVIRQRPVTDPSLLNLLEDCKITMNLHTPVAVIVTSQVKSPMLLGFVRPRLLLPEKILGSLNHEEIRYVLLHELSHLKRNDIMVNWFVTVLQILHWFNPIVWVAFGRMRADRERACDARALTYLKEGENISYGETIIKLLENFRRAGSLPSLAGILEDQNQMKTRMNMIAQFTKNSYRWSAIGLSLLLSLGVATFTDAKNQGKATQSLQKSDVETTAVKASLNHSLIEATEYGDVAKVKELLDKGADVNTKGPNGCTPLMMAVLSGHLEVVKLLLERGADPNLENNDKIPALILAEEHPEIEKLLLQKGAKDVRGEYLAQQLIGAAWSGDLDGVKSALDKGANVNAKSEKFSGGLTALIAAAQQGKISVVKLLLEKGADVNAKDAEGRTALMTVRMDALQGGVFSGGVDKANAIVKLLREKGAKEAEDMVQ